MSNDPVVTVPDRQPRVAGDSEAPTTERKPTQHVGRDASDDTDLQLDDALAAELVTVYAERNRARTDGSATVRQLEARLAELRARARAGGQLRARDLLANGRYRLEERLGAGGFGSVWRARDLEADVDVAIKVLLPELAASKSRKDRFIRGARNMSKLRHEAIVSVLESVGEEDGWFFFVMEHVAGGDLLHAVTRKRISCERAVELVLTAGAGLEHAHANGMIHRDVSPSNIMVGNDGKGLLTDFDLVLARDTSGGTRTGFMGKFLYSAPEVGTHPASATVRSDVFSIAMCVVFCFYGAEIPWVESYRGLPTIVDSLPCNRHVKRVLKQAIAMKPENRFDSVAAFTQSLRIAMATPDEGGPRFSAGARRARILIVDDEKFIRDILGDFLGMEGHVVATASTVEQALQANAGSPFDVALVDRKLVDGDGIELARIWKHQVDAPTVIFMTGFGTVEGAIEGMKLGAFDYILKPFKVEEIIHTVASALAARVSETRALE